MAAITGDWLEALRPEFSKPYYRDLFAFVQQEYRTRTIYPQRARPTECAFPSVPAARRLPP